MPWNCDSSAVNFSDEFVQMTRNTFQKSSFRSKTNANRFDTCWVCGMLNDTTGPNRTLFDCNFWIKLSIGNHFEWISVGIKFDEVSSAYISKYNNIPMFCMYAVELFSMVPIGRRLPTGTVFRMPPNSCSLN